MRNPGAVRLQCLGFEFQFDGDQLEALGALLTQWGWGRGSSGSEPLAIFRVETTGPYLSLFENDAAISREQSLPVCAQILRARMERLVASAPGERIYLNADVALLKPDEAIIVAGHPISGKTTLAQALSPGHPIWSERLLPLGADGALAKFPSQSPASPPRIRGIVKLDYGSHAEASIQVVSAGKMVMSLLSLVEDAGSKMPTVMAALSGLNRRENPICIEGSRGCLTRDLPAIKTALQL